MKTLVRIWMVSVVVCMIFTSCSTMARVHPAKRIAITKVHNPRIVVHKNVKYYRSSGIWYVKKNRKYVKATAPAGIKIKALPTGHKAVKVKGMRYYKCKGVYYKRSGQNYVVVHV